MKIGRPVTERICTFPGCTSKHNANGYCIKHGTRYKRHGDPAVVKPGGRPRGERPHGSPACYAAGCRCKICRRGKADRERERRHRLHGVRAEVPVDPLRGLVNCLLGFGIPERRLSVALGGHDRELRILKGKSAEAQTKEKLEKLHWDLWRSHGPFRAHCKCEWPYEIRQWVEAA